MRPLPEELLEQLTATLGITGAAYVRFKCVDGEVVAELLGTHETHCVTCQCNKFPPTPPAPENPRSRSWHENALTEKPK